MAAARDLAGRTGMKYTAALALVTPPGQPRQPRARWVLTDEVREFFVGVGWHGLYYGDLYDWLDGIRVTYTCDWCGEDGDARGEDSSIELVVCQYDPDVSPQTAMLTSKRHHARCQPSKVSWVRRVDIPAGPSVIGLPSTERPEMVGEYEITATPHVHADPAAPAVLLLTAAVTEDHGCGAVPWLNELDVFLRENGFGHPDSVFFTEGKPPEWTLRIATGGSSDRPWLGLRAGPLTRGEEPDHFFLGALDLAEVWVAQARSEGQVLVYAGPCTHHGQAPELDGPMDSDRIDELVEDGTLIGRLVPVADEHDPARISPRWNAPGEDA